VLAMRAVHVIHLPSGVSSPDRPNTTCGKLQRCNY
jgi:hypothetical protein